MWSLREGAQAPLQDFAWPVQKKDRRGKMMVEQASSKSKDPDEETEI